MLEYLQPDIALWSTKDRKIMLAELMAPWEEGCGEAYERMSSMYQSLVQECRNKGWQLWLSPRGDWLVGLPAKSA